MSFRRPTKILKESVGAYVAGVWVPGGRSLLSVDCSVQPAAMRTDLQALPEGRHLSDFVKVYTDVRLQISSDGEGIQSDIVVSQGYGYELMSIFENQSSVINHYKYLASKIFKFTADVNWTNGTLKRP